MSRYDHKIETSLEGIELEIDVGTPPNKTREDWNEDNHDTILEIQEANLIPTFQHPIKEISK